jgi:integral membrane protein
MRFLRSLDGLLKKYEGRQPFRDQEAWLLFRLAAFGEAAGWSLLITGIALRQFLPSHSQIPVLLAGQIHGMLFLLYALAAIGLYPSLRWSRWRALVALAASVPPYGSLLFEQWAAYKRHNSSAELYRCVMAYQFISASA